MIVHETVARSFPMVDSMILAVSIAAIAGSWSCGIWFERGSFAGQVTYYAERGELTARFGQRGVSAPFERG